MELEQIFWSPPDGSEPLPAWRLHHRALALTVLPTRGGKLVSLRRQGEAHEWLWLNGQLPWRPPQPGDSFVAQHDLGGWDECFPTVAPATVAGRSWPDHGDLWWRPWQSEPRDGGLWMGVEGEGYRFERHLEGAGEALRLRYRLSNLGSAPLPYLWCAHPLFCTEPPLGVELAGRPAVRLGSDGPFGRMGESHRWPTVQARRFSEFGKPSGQAVKLFVAVEKGQVALFHPSGTALRLRWDAAQLPVLGLWINEGGWSGSGGAPHCNVGVEPGNGAPDSLAVAIDEWDCYRTLQPGEQHSWWLELTFEREEEQE